MPPKNRNRTSKNILNTLFSIEWKKLETIFIVCGLSFYAGVHVGNFKSNVENNDKIYMMQNEMIELKKSYYSNMMEERECLLDTIRKLKEYNYLLRIELLDKK